MPLEKIKKTPAATTHFHRLQVAEVKRETPLAVSVKFAVPKHLTQAFSFEAGQFVTLRSKIDSEELSRNYSVCVSPLDGELRVAIKQTLGGLFSDWANTRLRAGDVLEVMPPIGRFVYPFAAGQSRRYVAFAGGSGITPILSLARTALAVENASQVTLFYGNRASGDVMFLEDLADLKDRYLDRFSMVHVLEDEVEEFALFNGRLDRAKCAELLALVENPKAVDAYFICGPAPMMDAAETTLDALGVAKEKIMLERFTTDAPDAKVVKRVQKILAEHPVAELSVQLDGRRSTVPFRAEHGNILDSARASGLRAPFACKGGVCGTCRARLTAGKVEMASNFTLTAEELADGYILTCQAIPITPKVTLTYDL
jgi:ring-1,2-phenylacetyl-CoA epoxidase subunit PaaE